MDAKPNQENQQVKVDVRLFSAKCSTKGEIYRFLATEAMVYLPTYQTVTIWHLKDLAASKKKVCFLLLIEYFVGHLQRRGQSNRCSPVPGAHHGHHP